ncbi:MAG: hypothetical protein HYX63_01655 [Gammaproteobacteria bacterium]|nr:hypothetical protein [Gammaproteobacteria bacterium]
MLSWLSIAIPWWGRALAILAIAAALFGYGWLKGARYEERKADAARAAQERANLVELQRVMVRDNQISTDYLAKLQGWATASANLTKELPKYVSPKADRNCALNNGFVQLWNAKPTADYSMPDATATADDAAKGVALSRAAVSLGAAKIAFAENKEQCEKLQKWAAGLNPR